MMRLMIASFVLILFATLLMTGAIYAQATTSCLETDSQCFDCGPQPLCITPVVVDKSLPENSAHAKFQIEEQILARRMEHDLAQANSDQDRLEIAKRYQDQVREILGRLREQWRLELETMKRHWEIPKYRSSEQE